jgi:hypothetical protein
MTQGEGEGVNCQPYCHVTFVFVKPKKCGVTPRGRGYEKI